MAKTSSGVTNRVSFGDGRLIYNGLSWPLRDAHATVSNKRSGLVGRKHVITLTVTSGDYTVMTWQARRTGAAATELFRPWSTFAANLNQAAAVEGSATGSDLADRGIAA
jgi:hypothetical protein